MPPLHGLIAIAILTLPGLGLVRVTPSLWSTSWSARLAWAFVLGLGGTGIVLYAASHWGEMPLTRPWIATVLGLLAALGLGLLWRGRPPVAAGVPRRGGPSPALLGLLAALFLPLLAEAVTNPVRDIDGRVTWVAHARYVRAAGTVDAPIFATREAMVAHPRYPLLMPLAQVATLELFATDDERAVRPLYATLWLAWALLLIDLTEWWLGRRVATRVGLAAAAVPVIAFGFDGGGASAYSDLPLACFVGAGFALLLSPGDHRAGIAAGILLGAALLTKNEGIVLVGLALLATLLARPPRTARRLLLALPTVLLTATLLISWSRPIPNRLDESYGARLSAASITDGAASLPLEGLPEIVRQMADWRAWGLIWVVVPIGLVLTLRRPSALRAPLGLVVAGGIGAYLAAYAIGPWSVGELVAATWTRCLLQLSVPLGLLAALAFAPGPAEPGGPHGRAPASARLRRWTVAAALGLHLAVGGFCMLRSALGFAAQIRFAGEDSRTARRRVLGAYAVGLEAAESALEPGARYLLVPRPGTTRHLVLQGDLAPRWAYRAPPPARARQRLQRETLPEWAVVYRGADAPPELLTAAAWVARLE